MEHKRAKQNLHYTATVSLYIHMKQNKWNIGAITEKERINKGRD